MTATARKFDRFEQAFALFFEQRVSGKAGFAALSEADHGPRLTVAPAGKTAIRLKGRAQGRVRDFKGRPTEVIQIDGHGPNRPKEMDTRMFRGLSPEKLADKVVLTGWRVGETHWGEYVRKARVKADGLVPTPFGLTTLAAMAVGTAGFTAMQEVVSHPL